MSQYLGLIQPNSLNSQRRIHQRDQSYLAIRCENWQLRAPPSGRVFQQNLFIAGRRRFSAGDSRNFSICGKTSSVTVASSFTDFVSRIFAAMAGLFHRAPTSPKPLRRPAFQVPDGPCAYPSRTHGKIDSTRALPIRNPDKT